MSDYFYCLSELVARHEAQQATANHRSWWSWVYLYLANEENQ